MGNANICNECVMKSLVFIEMHTILSGLFTRLRRDQIGIMSADSSLQKTFSLSLVL